MRHEEYEQIPGVNWSTLKHFTQSPAHYLHSITARTADDSDAKQRGRVLHMAVFEPERFVRDVVVYHERRVGKDFDAFCAKHEGKEIITPRMDDHVRALSAAARASPMAGRYLAGGVAESVCKWTYRSPEIQHIESFSVGCKGRLDFIADCGAIVDLKSTRDGSPTGFAREVLRYEYHAQAAFYVDGYAAMTGRHLPFVFVAVETKAPHVVQVYRVSDEDLDLGRERYALMLAHLNVCRSESKWPGYAETEMELALPRWHRGSDDEEFDEDLAAIAATTGDASEPRQ